mmetsp:Transcript_67/g.224  ORF Transcript_67/g.224 Transcript_67/m.224 type:complete len:322 (+) Transcript_67:871-1836(+)
MRHSSHRWRAWLLAWHHHSASLLHLLCHLWLLSLWLRHHSWCDGRSTCDRGGGNRRGSRCYAALCPLSLCRRWRCDGGCGSRRSGGGCCRRSGGGGGGEWLRRRRRRCGCGGQGRWRRRCGGGGCACGCRRGCGRCHRLGGLLRARQRRSCCSNGCRRLFRRLLLLFFFGCPFVFLRQLLLLRLGLVVVVTLALGRRCVCLLQRRHGNAAFSLVSVQLLHPVVDTLVQVLDVLKVLRVILVPLDVVFDEVLDILDNVRRQRVVFDESEYGFELGDVLLVSCDGLLEVNKSRRFCLSFFRRRDSFHFSLELFDLFVEQVDGV